MAKVGSVWVEYVFFSVVLGIGRGHFSTYLLVCRKLILKHNLIRVFYGKTDNNRLHVGKYSVRSCINNNYPAVISSKCKNGSQEAFFCLL